MIEGDPDLREISCRVVQLQILCLHMCSFAVCLLQSIPGITSLLPPTTPAPPQMSILLCNDGSRINLGRSKSFLGQAGSNPNSQFTATWTGAVLTCWSRSKLLKAHGGQVCLCSAVVTTKLASSKGQAILGVKEYRPWKCLLFKAQEPLILIRNLVEGKNEMYQSRACNFETLNERRKDESWFFDPINRQNHHFLRKCF